MVFLVDIHLEYFKNTILPRVRVENFASTYSDHTIRSGEANQTTLYNILHSLAKQPELTDNLLGGGTVVVVVVARKYFNVKKDI